MTHLCFVDTETTGLDPDRHEIWEVGLIVRNHPDGSHLDGEYLWQLRPERLQDAEVMALKISRFHDRVLASIWNGEADVVLLQAASREVNSGFAVTYQQFAAQFVELTIGAHMVGAVPSFDTERLWKLLRRWGQTPMWHYHLSDIEVLMVGWLSAQGESILPPWKSHELSRRCGVDPDEAEAHTALGDARWAMLVWDRVMTGPAPVAAGLSN